MTPCWLCCVYRGTAWSVTLHLVYKGWNKNGPTLTNIIPHSSPSVVPNSFIWYIEPFMTSLPDSFIQLPLNPLTNCFPILSHGLLVGLWYQFGGLPPVFSEWRIIKQNVCGTHRIILWNTSFWYMSVCVYVPDHVVRFYFFYRLWSRCLKATAPGVASAILLPALSELHAFAHGKYFSLSGWQTWTCLESTQTSLLMQTFGSSPGHQQLVTQTFPQIPPVSVSTTCPCLTHFQFFSA